MPPRRWRELAREVLGERARERFGNAHVAGLPEPARRHLLHAIAQGAPLARAVRLATFFRMRLRAGDRVPAALTGEELLAPPAGFVWRARTRLGRVPVRVADHYVRGRGGVRVTALGVLPVARTAGPDVTRSARGRLAGEAIWFPPALLPARGASWAALDAERARVTLTIDGEALTLTLRVADDGRLREMTMLRHGDVGVDSWRALPYGVEVLEEASFGGYTIPTRARGGWWYGSERASAAGASEFKVVAADFL
jgi:hypothetical protein